MRFSEYLSRIGPGETVLIEHTSLSPYPRLFHAIGSVHGWEKVLLIDILDSTMSAIRWLRLAGFTVPQHTKRIKAGGMSEWGEVLFEVDPYKDPGIFLSRLSKWLRDYYSKNPGTIAIIMNPERLIPLQNNNPRFVVSLTNLSVAFIGNSNKKAFYFVNTDLADKRYVALLEEAFTRVIRIGDEGKTVIVKSPGEEEGASLEPV
ncbi:DUF257 family protein [Thermococcus sp. MAR1]|uniref:DUF257 family protein n=1 Tax=Thermococcus sp. MAR1 TaxID=1638263 RepID=UPI00143A8598|nr:DUF257 family protein [Thermococcus sp. MAR1]NJE11033.1 hypothetical protein [Thermococcus sp. MAR1]